MSVELQLALKRVGIGTLVIVALSFVTSPIAPTSPVAWILAGTVNGILLSLIIVGLLRFPRRSHPFAIAGALITIGFPYLVQIFGLLVHRSEIPDRLRSTLEYMSPLGYELLLLLL